MPRMHALSVDLDRQTGYQRLFVAGDGDFDQSARLQKVRVVGKLVGSRDRRKGQRQRLELCDELLARHGGEQRANLRQDDVARLDALIIERIGRISAQVAPVARRDRKSVGEGKRVSVRVNSGGGST